MKTTKDIELIVLLSLMPIFNANYIQCQCPMTMQLNGEEAQWLGHRIADRKVSSSSPALPTVLRVRDISKPKQAYGSLSRMYRKLCMRVK